MHYRHYMGVTLPMHLPPLMLSIFVMCQFPIWKSLKTVPSLGEFHQGTFDDLDSHYKYWAADSISPIKATFSKLNLLMLFISTNLLSDGDLKRQKQALSCIFIVFSLESTSIMHKASTCG